MARREARDFKPILTPRYFTHPLFSQEFSKAHQLAKISGVIILRSSHFIMIERILVNGRFSGQPMTGAQRYAREVTQRLGFRAHLLTPKHSFRGWQGHSWEQLALPGLIPRGEMLWSPVNSG
jgi:hypothetical protein